MRKGIQVAAAAVLALMGCSCGQKARETYFSTTDGLVEFLFPAGWQRSDQENPYDLQCSPRERSLMTGIFLYRTSDLASDTTPQGLFQFQVDDIRSKRDHFGVLEPKTIADVNGKRLTTAVYSGDKDMSEFHYRFMLIKFTDNPDILVIAIQTSIPSSWETDKPILEGITESARIAGTE